MNNLQSFAENASDWEIFEGVLPMKNMAPSDIDGYYERFGNTLFLEEKSGSKTIPTGQSITFNNWSSHPDKIVMVLWYDKTYLYDENHKEIIDEHGLHEFTRDYYKVQIYVYGMQVYSRRINDTKKPRRFVQNWFKWATQNPYLTKEQMIARVTNGLTADDYKMLFAGIMNIPE